MDLIITDNTEKTIERAVQKKVDSDVKLKRSVFWGINSSEKDLKSLAVDLINSGELLNLNKETVKIKIGEKYFDYKKDTGVVEMPKLGVSTTGNNYYVFEKQDFVGMAKTNEIHHYLSGTKVDLIEKAIMWNIQSTDDEVVLKTINSYILHNPYSMEIKA